MSFSCSAPGAASRSPPFLRGDLRQRSLPERAPDHRGLLRRADARTARASPAARPAAPGPCPAARPAGLPALARQPHHLLGEQRVAARALGHRCHRPPSRRRAQKRPDQLARLARWSAARARSRSRSAAAAPARRGARAARRGPGRASAAALAPTARGTRSGRACRGRPSGCPRRPAPAGCAAPSPRCTKRTAEKKVSRMRCGSSASSGARVDRRLDAQQPTDQRRAPVARSPEPGLRLPEQLGQIAARQLLPGHVGGVAVDDPDTRRGRPRRAPSRRCSSRTGGSVPGGRSGRVGPAQRELVLPQQARLADAGLADHRHEVRAPLPHDAAVDGLQQCELVVAPDQRRLAAGSARRDGAEPARPSPPRRRPARPCP